MRACCTLIVSNSAMVEPMDSTIELRASLMVVLNGFGCLSCLSSWLGAGMERLSLTSLGLRRWRRLQEVPRSVSTLTDAVGVQSGLGAVEDGREPLSLVLSLVRFLVMAMGTSDLVVVLVDVGGASAAGVGLANRENIVLLFALEVVKMVWFGKGVEEEERETTLHSGKCTTFERRLATRHL